MITGYWGYWNGKTMFYFRTYEEMIVYLASHNTKCGSEVDNPVFNYIGTNDNDVYTGYEGVWTTNGFEYRKRVFQRDHRIITPYGTVIWNNGIKRDIINITLNNRDTTEIYESWRKWYRSTFTKRKYTGRYAYLNFKNNYKYRKDPVPNIHHPRGYKVYHGISVMNEKRHAADPDNTKFYRGSRGVNLPNVYDTEPMRDWRNTGWKRQGPRMRKQWMKAPRKAKGVYVDKRNSLREMGKAHCESINDWEIEGLGNMGEMDEAV